MEHSTIINCTKEWNCPTLTFHKLCLAYSRHVESDSLVGIVQGLKQEGL